MEKFIKIVTYSLIILIGLVIILVLALPACLYIFNASVEDPFIAAIQTLRIGNDSWDWLAYTVALLSLLITVATLISQNKTETNTQQINDLSQQNILKEFTAHFYRNLIVLCALTKKMEGRWSTHYPSEEHLVKLKVDMDPSVFRKHAKNYDYIYELQLLTTNFNTEVDIVLTHLKGENVPEYVKQRDMATLRFKMDFLTRKVTELMGKIWKHDYKNAIVEHVQNAGYRRIGAKGDNTEQLKEDSLRLAALVSDGAEGGMNYIKPVESTYYYQMFADDQEREDFYKILNALIHIELTSDNNQGYPKLLLMPFDNKTNDCI